MHSRTAQASSSARRPAVPQTAGAVLLLMLCANFSFALQEGPISLQLQVSPEMAPID